MPAPFSRAGTALERRRNAGEIGFRLEVDARSQRKWHRAALSYSQCFTPLQKEQDPGTATCNSVAFFAHPLEVGVNHKR